MQARCMIWHIYKKKDYNRSVLFSKTGKIDNLLIHRGKIEILPSVVWRTSEATIYHQEQKAA